MCPAARTRPPYVPLSKQIFKIVHGVREIGTAVRAEPLHGGPTELIFTIRLLGISFFCRECLKHYS